MKNSTWAIGLLVAIQSVFMSSSAFGQSVDYWLHRKYDIQQQQVDAERKRAEAEQARADSERKRAEAAATSSSEVSAQPPVSSAPLPQGDSLGANAPACILSNGSTIRTTRGFRPSPQANTVCKK